MRKNNTPKLNSSLDVLLPMTPILIVGVYAIVQEIMLML